jgi:acyl transferase domain-containing protein/NADPH:quinone reductase-like Zn-dependent oxidoreductase/NAD(P)-dependent dehydrogenase (short-subunit alcohol dehydrogenase family)/acyl carrier protein/SAM-dependent methyltransferase
MTDGSIAIVGASCRFPGADNLEGFWQLLASAGDAVSEIGDERWSTRYYFHPNRAEPGKSYTWSAGLITGVDLFEPSFFGISPREAAQMDPQQRLLLELVWHALEDAGIPPSKMSGNASGVYIGASATDYSDLRLGDPAGADSYFMTGSTLSILANRISYVFDLQGPSLAIDTACSSSLVALHHACEAIRGNRIASAIVGGVNLLLAPYPFIGFSRAAMLSRRGRCFAFDERADGYVRGEGGGVIILKPLEDALANGDPIRAVILASGANSDGRTIGLSLPSESAQASLLRSVYARAGIVPDDLAFFEMHGTGTAAGDPIEAAAVGNSLGRRRSAPLPIGSVKTNIGHLEPASGMAGLLKAALALDRGFIPPSLHCETPNPNIPFDTLNLRLVREVEPFAIPPYAGVNSFGFGGTNAHVVVARAPRRAEAPSIPTQIPPLMISARTEASLRELVRSWRTTLVETSSERTPMLLRAAARGRDHYPQRLVALGQDAATLARELNDFLNDYPAPAIIAGTAVREGKLAFVFSGNGAQFTGMGRDALRTSAAFRAAIEEVDGMLRPHLGWSVVELLENSVDPEAMARADVAQPLLFAVQVGIVQALRGIGVNASGYVGHSVGEIAAAWAAGALSLAEAGRVVVARSRYQQRTKGQGRMAAVALARDAARDFLAELDSPAEIAALNATHSITISGPSAEIERLEGEAKQRGLWFRTLDLDFAFHSREMDPIREDLLASLIGLSSRRPNAHLVSTVTGEEVGEEPLDADYWWRNIRNPVRFAEAIAQLISEGCRIFLEIGPAAILHSYLTDGLRVAKAEGRVLASLSRKPVHDDPFPAIAAHCHVAGYDLTRASCFDGPADPRGLPLYPWDRQKFWFDVTVEAVDPTNPPFDHPLLGFRQRGPIPCWLNHLDEQVLPWIGDHAVEEMPVFPAAAMVEMALAAARWRWPDAPVLEVLDLELRRPLPFDKGRMREMRTLIGSEEGDWELASRPRLSSEPLTVHAVGRLGSATDVRPKIRWPDNAPTRCQIDRETLYHLARLTGLDYGSRFRTVSRIEIAGSEAAVAHLDAAPLDGDLDPYLLHPGLLDGALQALLGLVADRSTRLEGVSFLPWRFGRVRLLAPFGRVPRRAQLRLTRIGVRSVSTEIALFDIGGDLVAELADCWFRRVELTRRGANSERALRVDLVPAPLTESGALPSSDSYGAILSRLAAARQPDPARQEQALLLDALIGSVALRSMRAIVEPGRAFTIPELTEAGLVAAASSSLAQCLLRLLERFGAATKAGSEWRLDASTDLPYAEEVWRLLLAEAPDLVAELALIASAAEGLPKVLSGGPHQPDVALSPTGEHLLQASPASAASVDLLCDALQEIASRWPQSRPLRILELGAISGGATRRVLERLARSNVSLAYLATSVGPDQAARLSYLAESFTGVSARQWSPQGERESLEGARFDIILAVNACARLQLDAASLASLRDRLAPGGIFIAVEPEPNPLWDLVFGQSPEWWGSDARGGDASPLRSSEEWRAELAAAGFRATDAASSAWAPWPCGVFWGTAPPGSETARSDPTKPSSVLVVAGNTAFPAAVQDSLHEAGHRVTLCDPSDFIDADRPGQRIAGDEGLEIVLFLAEEPVSGNPVECASQQIAALAQVATEAAERDAALWVITCDAQQATAAPEPVCLVGGALWSLARVLVNEMPRLSLRLIDLAGNAPPGERARQIAAELAAAADGEEIVWTPQGRHVLRVRRGLPPRWAKESDLLTLGSRHPGGLDSLGWEISPSRAVGPSQVEIEVHAAGLNFRDMMWAMGLLPEEALIDGFAGPTFGLECAGIVRSLGSGVQGLAVGDRVMGFAPASFSTRVVTVADAVAPIPPETSFAEAATIPVTFVTAMYSLGHLAKLAPGECVLIHAAAGGVGLAAIQYAKHCGAVVIATAGSEVKRSFLRLAGADHVLDSRDLGFSDAVREITGGRGVDIVLNSLSGEGMDRSLEVLKPFGRFLELGKRDLYLNRRIHLRPLRQNISYFAIDIDQLPILRPDLARDLLARVSSALSEGAIRPLAHRAFSFAELDDAFRLMQSSSHIGKLVLLPRANAGVQLRGSPPIEARRDGTYLITGGLEGFGYEAARWLVAHGAGSIALVGRRGPDTPGCAARVGELEGAGAEVRVYRCDVADRTSLARVLDAIRADQAPLRGVVHAASAIDDGFAAEIELARAKLVFRPKLGGAFALDALTRNDPIELFLLFSSATTLVGAPGQGVYVAANMALEALARRRQAEGRPALAVAWGPIEDVGYLAERPEARDALARRLGAKPIPAAQALAGLPAMIASGLPMVAFAETNWNEARRFLPILGTQLFSEIRGGASTSPSDDSLGDRLASLDPEAALALLKTVIAEEAATILRLPAGGIDPLRPLSEMGMDSLMAVELRLALESRLRVDLPLMSLAEGTSVASIAARLAGAVSTGSSDGELIALVARHEGVDDSPLPAMAGRAASSMLEAKSVAAE